MKYAVFNILIIVLVGLLYTSGVFKFFASSYLLWGVIGFIVILFIIAIKIMGIPTSKN